MIALQCRTGVFTRLIILMALCCLGASCATKPARYQDLASSAQLRANGNNTDGRVPFNTAIEPSALKAYTFVTLDPVRIYRGKDGQFGTLSEDAKNDLARHAEVRFRAELARRGLLAAAVGPRTLRLKITLTGVETNVPVLGTATKMTPVGFALSGLRSVRDKEGRFTGAVIYAGELFDAASGRLVYAFVTRQYPNALNIPASILPLDAALAGLDRGATVTASSLQSMMAGATR